MKITINQQKCLGFSATRCHVNLVGSSRLGFFCRHFWIFFCCQDVRLCGARVAESSRQHPGARACEPPRYGTPSDCHRWPSPHTHRTSRSVGLTHCSVYFFTAVVTVTVHYYFKKNNILL